ncbi:ragulator complex protein LAMTOR4 homolog isoform X1 [Hydra vulgaris]|uniref:Late endosomal/lysosomal adaptor and MAPK and MTOR activator 4 n=1 Tax=Hydra vulgaris TaxID=6087 RepID=T2MDV0_HYDVU|nr:ragulator complex protein LAMTOR4 homolog [Hydra vulgaris]
MSGSSSLLMGIDKIADNSGYFVLNREGAVLSSAGDLENDEETANQILDIIYSASKVSLSKKDDEYFQRISLIYSEFVLLVTVCNSRIFVVKRPLAKSDKNE